MDVPLLNFLESISQPISSENTCPNQDKRPPKRYKLLKSKLEPLTSKKAIEFLLAGTLRKKVCRFCLMITQPLSELDQILRIAGKDAIYEITIRDIVASFHPFKVVDDENFPNKICNKCLDRSLKSYLFTQQCEQAERALRNCFEDIFEKSEKLDPLEPQLKKRGRHKTKVNHNILYPEHLNVMDYAEPIRHLIHTGSNTYTAEPKMGELECKKCWQVLPNVESLANHEKSHPKSMWYNCRLCGHSAPKLYLFKRHLRTHLRKMKPVAEAEDHRFECKRCGVISEDYMMHLQHLEKHKFQKVMKCLLEKNMDKLCSVCLEDGKLMDLDKTVCLHGGYPELSGDRPLVNILGSSVPEKRSSAKYQELYIPQYANIMTIRKVSKSVHQNAYENRKFAFKMAQPVVVTAEDNIQNDGVYTFVFSKPINVSDSEKANMRFDETHETVVEDVKHKSDEECTTVVTEERTDAFSCKQMVTYDKEINNSEQAINRDGEVNDSEESIGRNASLNNNEYKNEKCKVLKVFKSIGEFCNFKCNFVTLNNKIDADGNNEDNDVITTEVEKQKNYCHGDVGKNTNKNDIPKENTTELQGNSTNIARKRKLTDTESKIPEKISRKYKTEITPRRTEWNCDICLTVNNTNREICICCDNPRNLKTEFYKVNLKPRKDWLFNYDTKLTEKSNVIKTEFNKTDHKQQMNCAEEKGSENITKNTNFDKTKMEVFDDISMDYIPLKYNEDKNVFCEETTAMTNVKEKVLVKNSYVERTESMEYEENNTVTSIIYNSTDNTSEPKLLPELLLPKIHISNTAVYPEPKHQVILTPNSVNLNTSGDDGNFAGTSGSQTPMFQFHIGSSSVKDKDKNSRRLKRMHSSMHK